MAGSKTPRKQPVRMCVGCKERFPKKELIRIVRTPEGEIKIDRHGKMSGRGAYICDSADCLTKAIKTKALQRALEVPIDDSVIEELTKDISE